MRNLRSAILLGALLGANAPGAGQETCRPVLSAKSSGHSTAELPETLERGVYGQCIALRDD